MEIRLGRNRVLQAIADTPVVPFVRRHEKAEGLVVLTVSVPLISASLLGATVASAAILAPGMVDLSNNNGPGAVAAIAARGVKVVEAKATEGLAFRDPDFPIFRRAATQHRRVFGGYMFLHPDESPAAQVNYFLAYARPRRGDMEPIVDSELGGACASGPATLAALKALQAKGYDPILYSNTSWLEQFARCEPGLKRFRVWEAEYGPTLNLVPGFHVIAWQFTDAAYENGFSVDGSHLLVRKLSELEIPAKKPNLTPAQKRARALGARKARLRRRHGYQAWHDWLHATGPWKGLKPHEPDARPHVPVRVPSSWWRRNAPHPKPTCTP